jgi:hypothetical protein
MAVTKEQLAKARGLWDRVLMELGPCPGLALGPKADAKARKWWREFHRILDSLDHDRQRARRRQRRREAADDEDDSGLREYER